MSMTWNYKNIPLDRVKRLLTPIDFDSLVHTISQRGKLVLLDQCVEGNKDSLELKDSVESLERGACRRVVFRLNVPRDTYDTFVNSPYGLFGRYHESVDSGRQAMRQIVESILANCDMISQLQQKVANEGAMDAAGLLSSSLNPTEALIWFYEGEFPKQWYPKKNAMNFVGPAKEQIWSDRWNGRPVFRCGQTLEVKGCWVTDDYRIAIYNGKRNFHELVHQQGFS